MARRTWGEGSVFYDTVNACWVWRGTYVGVGGEKKRKSFTAHRQIDLKAKVDAFKLKLAEGGIIERSVTVEEWVNRWLEVFVKPTCKQKTYENYRVRLGYICEVIGKKNLVQVTSIELQEIFNELRFTGGKTKKGISAESVNCARRYFKACCNVAVKNRLIQINPVEGTRPQKKSKKEIVVMDEEDLIRFLNVAEKGDYIYWGADNPKFVKRTDYYIKQFYVLVSLSLATGMRISEVRGLKWKNINFSRKFINVTEQLVDTAEKGDVFDEPKSEKSKRKIFLDETTWGKIKAFKKYQMEYANFLGDLYRNKFGLVFTNIFGNPINLTNFRKRYFNKMLEAARIKKGFTIHSMRHTHATLLLKKGVNIKVVSERLGHSSATVTMNIYAHVLESMEQTAPSVWALILKDTQE